MGESASQVMLTPGIQSAYSGMVGARAKKSKVSLAAEGKSAAGEAGARGVPAMFAVEGAEFLKEPELGEEVFGPTTLVVSYGTRDQMLEIARGLQGHLTATLHGTDEDLREYRELVEILEQKAGRLVFNGFPTGVEVGHAIVHGGPYPATSDGQSTSVGSQAIYRFVRPVCFQNFPTAELPEELKDGNPTGIWRLKDGALTKD